MACAPGCGKEDAGVEASVELDIGTAPSDENRQAKPDRDRQPFWHKKLGLPYPIDY
jgi:hypothetical protein